MLPVGLMLAGMIGAAYLQRDNAEPAGPRNGEGHPPQPTFELPFSSVAALKFGRPESSEEGPKFGLLFLAIQIGSTLAQRALGTLGFYIVSIAGGAVSSASAVASAANLAAAGTVSSRVAAMGAVIASVVSALVDLPMVRLADDRRLTRKVTVVLTATVVAGGLGAVIAWMLWRR